MIKYTASIGKIPPANLPGFFVGWAKPPSPETHLRILQNSYKVVLAIDEEANRVVGFINAISDGVIYDRLRLRRVAAAFL
jgi:hypothetical protein